MRGASLKQHVGDKILMNLIGHVKEHHINNDDVDCELILIAG